MFEAGCRGYGGSGRNSRCCFGKVGVGMGGWLQFVALGYDWWEGG